MDRVYSEGQPEADPTVSLPSPQWCQVSVKSKSSLILCTFNHQFRYGVNSGTSPLIVKFTRVEDAGREEKWLTRLYLDLLRWQQTKSLTDQPPSLHTEFRKPAAVVISKVCAGEVAKNCNYREAAAVIASPLPFPLDLSTSISSINPYSTVQFPMSSVVL